MINWNDIIDSNIIIFYSILSDILLEMATKKILCIGGSGQLGKQVIKSLLPYSVTNVDFS